MREPLERIVISATRQPPLAFFGRYICTIVCVDEITREPYMELSAYKIELCNEAELVDQCGFGVSGEEYDLGKITTRPQIECIVIDKDVHIDTAGTLENPETFHLKQYIILKYPYTEAHDELYEFCQHKTSHGKVISSDFLRFIERLGVELFQDPYHFYNNKPWEIAK